MHVCFILFGLVWPVTSVEVRDVCHLDQSEIALTKFGNSEKFPALQRLENNNLTGITFINGKNSMLTSQYRLK